MTRSILVGEVRTGRRIATIPVSNATWAVAHRGTGTIDVDIPLNAGEFRKLERIIHGQYPSGSLFPGPTTFPTAEAAVWRAGQGLRPEFLSAIEPARTFLAILEGDSVLESGPIWAHDYDYATGILKVKAAGWRSIFDHRYVMAAISGTDWATWSVTYSGISLGTQAKRLIELLMSHTGGNLPIVLPEDETAADDADHTRTLKGFELATVASRLDQLQGVQGGPDIAFEGRLTSDRMGLEVLMRVGTEAQPLLFQVGGDHVFDTRVPRGGVSGLSVHRDGAGLASRSWATGSGMDEALLMGRAPDNTTLTDGGFPLLEIAEAHSSVEVQSTLDAWAAGNLSAAAAPWMTWSASVRADMSPLLGSYRTGDFAKVWVPKSHPYLSLLLPEGFHRARIVNISGDLGPNVNLTFAPVMESR
jgi:hypothetical protein